MPPYLKFYFAALTKYKVHSPFVFEFMSDIFEDERCYHSFGIIENYRRNLLGIGEKIKVNQQEQTIHQLVKKRAIPSKIGEILFKTVHLYKPDTLLEIGTNLGISTLYQATPNPHVPLITLEEDRTLASKTSIYFKKLGTKNIQILDGANEENLQKALGTLQTIEHLFLNGFWGKTTTLSHFEACLPHFLPNTVFIFRTPYASAESLDFWESIKANEKVKLSIDIYDLGFLFFRSEQKEVAHYKLIESWKKPWAVY